MSSNREAQLKDIIIQERKLKDIAVDKLHKISDVIIDYNSYHLRERGGSKAGGVPFLGGSPSVNRVIAEAFGGPSSSLGTTNEVLKKIQDIINS